MTLAASAGLADVIVHKNGQKLEGVITSENEKSVVIDVGGAKVPLDRSEILSIKKGKVAAPKPKAEASKAAAETAAPAEDAHVKLVFDARRWKVGMRKDRPEMGFSAYVPEGQTTEQWTEIVMVQFFPGQQDKANPDGFALSAQQTLLGQCPGTKFNVLSSTKDDIVYGWSRAACPAQPDQSEIVRVARAADGMVVLHYAVKNGNPPNELMEAWIGRIRSAQLLNPLKEK